MNENSAHLSTLFFERMTRSSQSACFVRRDRGSWVSQTWQEFGQDVFLMASVLQDLGVTRGSRVAVISQSRFEAAVVDYAVVSLGAVVVPIYHSLNMEDVAWIIRQSRCSIVFVEDSAQRAKVQGVLKPSQHHIDGIDIRILGFDTPGEAQDIFNLQDLISQKKNTIQDWDLTFREWSMWSKVYSPDDLACVLYTSGTTGQPKGVELSHRNFFAVMEQVVRLFEVRSEDTSLLFLPVSHVMGRLELYLPLFAGNRLVFSSGFRSLLDELREIEPTILLAVPRLFEKIFAEVLHKLDHRSLPQKLASKWIFSVASEYSRRLQSGVSIPPLLTAQYQLAKSLVFDRVHEAFGQHLRWVLCGGAPIQRDLVEFFHACGVLILEGYGLTETTGPVAVNVPGRFRFGSVGQVLSHTELKILADGEICVKGPGVFRGYLLDPEARDSQDQVSTDDVFLEGSWFRTGDLGFVDEHGFLYIQDRKKDVIKTSGGKTVSPQKIETLLTSDPLFQHALIVGEGRSHIGALLVLDSVTAHRLAEDHGIHVQSLDQLREHSEFLKIVATRLKPINQRLSAFEKIRRFRVLKRGFSMETGELTASLKIRRRFCFQKYQSDIEELFGGEENL